jgi:hypothetical protein
MPASLAEPTLRVPADGGGGRPAAFQTAKATTVLRSHPLAPRLSAATSSVSKGGGDEGAVLGMAASPQRSISSIFKLENKQFCNHKIIHIVKIGLYYMIKQMIKQMERKI